MRVSSFQVVSCHHHDHQAVSSYHCQPASWKCWVSQSSTEEMTSHLLHWGWISIVHWGSSQLISSDMQPLLQSISMRSPSNGSRWLTSPPVGRRVRGWPSTCSVEVSYWLFLRCRVCSGDQQMGHLAPCSGQARAGDPDIGLHVWRYPDQGSHPLVTKSTPMVWHP